MYPGLSHGAYDALQRTAPTSRRRPTCRKLASGDWTGTMCLTEPHCGTDLGLLRTKAEPQRRRQLQAHRAEDLHPRRRTRPGRQHRAPGAGPAAGRARGQQGHLAVRGAEVQGQAPTARWASATAIFCGALEHKMGIHGNADLRRSTWTAPIGTLVGQPQQGPGGDVRDDERGAPGRRQPVAGADRGGLPERAWPMPRTACRCARCPARRRPDKPADPIIVHPDVRKMLLTARAYAEGGRALAMYCALLLDKEHHHADDEAERKDAADLVALLTPIVKAFLTDNGWIATIALPAGLRRPRLHQGMGHGAVRARRPHQHDLRGHQHDPVAGPAGPQGARRQRREAEEVRRAWCASWSRKKARTRRCRSSSTRWPTWATS